MRPRLTDTNLKNSLLVSATNLTPNIEKLVNKKQTQISHFKERKCKVYLLL